MNLASCATLPLRQFQQLGPCVSFQELIRKGDALSGKRVLLGGYILKTANEAHGSILTILQTPLDSRNEPQAEDLSEGRFLVQVEEFLDPEIYCKGRKFTVGGRVLEVRTEPLGNRSYPYPVIVGEEFHLWPKETPSVTIYDPYYPYWYYPWHRYPYAPDPWWVW